MVTVALYKPRIPPNTGNIMRLCSNMGFELNIVKPTGFSIDDKALKRARMDYFSNTEPILYDNFKKFLNNKDSNHICVVTKYGDQLYNKVNYTNDSILLFGSETNGLPKEILHSFSNKLIKIPMISGSRSLNLSNAVAIVAYEAWKQLKFSGAW